MKKSIFIAVLGLAAVAATSSYGQGYIAFSSYVANQAVGVITTFPDGVTPVPGSFTAELYYAIGTVTNPANFTAIPSTITPYDSNGDGYFSAQNPAVIPGYSSGSVSFEVFATGVYNGVAYTGFTAPFTESTIANSLSSPLTSFGDNGPGMPALVVSPVPEPTTLALAGLGGLASLVAFRRKQS
jgi:hypothetical protein